MERMTDYKPQERQDLEELYRKQNVRINGLEQENKKLKERIDELEKCNLNLQERLDRKEELNKSYRKEIEELSKKSMEAWFDKKARNMDL